MNSEFYLPYLLNYAQPVAEEIIIFCIAALTAIVVSAEGQGFAATLLGDSKPGATDRLHFDFSRHLSVLGTLNFLVAGFGWAREIQIDQRNFKKHPKLYLLLSRLAGPIGNLLMANIAASLSWILTKWDFDDQVFSTIVVVNVTMAIYGLLVIPPLPGFAFLAALFPDSEAAEKLKRQLCKAGPFVIIIGFLIIRLTGWQGISSVFNPIVSAITAFTLDF